MRATIIFSLLLIPRLGWTQSYVDPRLATVRLVWVDLLNNEVDGARPVAACFVRRLTDNTALTLATKPADADVVLQFSELEPTDILPLLPVDLVRRSDLRGLVATSVAAFAPQKNADGTVEIGAWGNLWISIVFRDHSGRMFSSEDDGRDPLVASGSDLACQIADKLAANLLIAMRKARDGGR